MANKLHQIVAIALLCSSTGFLPPRESAAQIPIEPTAGQPGKDVVWVPTPPELVEKMLDMANVTPLDFVMDLGSGDGRNVIAAAKRGARALGVEYDPDLVELSRRLAKEAGVADRAIFVQGDMYEADVSEATVLALFLLPENLDKMRDKFLARRRLRRSCGNMRNLLACDWILAQLVRSFVSCCGYLPGDRRSPAASCRRAFAPGQTPCARHDIT